MFSDTRPATVGKWTEPALRVLRERYLNRRGDEVLETPEELCWRVAQAIAKAEERWGKSAPVVHEVATAFYDMMVEGTFLPNSPTLMNAGKGNQLQYSACYVLPVGDSMEEIFDAVKAAAIIHKSGGGTGFAFSRLRQKDALVVLSQQPRIRARVASSTEILREARTVRSASALPSILPLTSPRASSSSRSEVNSWGRGRCSFASFNAFSIVARACERWASTTLLH